MLFYNVPLADYDVDSFIMPVGINNRDLLLKFRWPTEVQQLYNMQLAVIDDSFRSQPFYLPADGDNIQHTGFTQELIDRWQLYVDTWAIDGDTTDIVNNTLWPTSMKDAVKAVIGNPALPDLKNSIQLILDSLRPSLSYLADLDDELLWRISVREGEETRELCLQPGVVYFHNEKDWRLQFMSEQERITRGNLGEVILYIITGDGDV